MADELTFEELFADLVEASTRTLPEQYFTVREFADRTGKPTRTALRELVAMAEEGRLEMQLAVLDGHQARVFWFAGDE